MYLARRGSPGRDMPRRNRPARRERGSASRGRTYRLALWRSSCNRASSRSSSSAARSRRAGFPGGRRQAGAGRFVAIENGTSLRALCHVGVNVVPAGEGCGEFAEETLRSRALMIIGAEEAVTDLWDEVGDQMRGPREDRRRQPVFAIEEPPPAGRTGLRAATRADLDRLVPACAAAHEGGAR